MEGLIWLVLVGVFYIVKMVAENNEAKTNKPNPQGAPPLGSSSPKKSSLLETLQAHLEESLAVQAEPVHHEKPALIHEEPRHAKPPVVPFNELGAPEEDHGTPHSFRRVERTAIQEALIWKEILSKPVSLR